MRGKRSLQLSKPLVDVQKKKPPFDCCPMIIETVKQDLPLHQLCKTGAGQDKESKELLAAKKLF
jgi:hypothetical protein